MKIGILIDRLNVGGVEKSAVQEVIALRKMNVDASLFVLSQKSVVEGAHSDLVSQVPVIYLDKYIPRIFRVTFKFPGFAFFSLFHVTYPILLSIFMKKDICDYIISHGSYTTLSSLFIRIFKKIPYSIYFWDPTNYILKRVYKGKFPRYLLRGFAFLGRFVDMLLVRFSDVVFVASDTHNKYLKKYVSEESIKIVYPGTPLGTPSKEKDKDVLMVTTWKKGKHPDYVFELLEEYPQMHITMVGGWLGEGFRDNFEKVMKEKGFEKNIELWGEANEEQLKKLYPKSLVQLTTNLEKGFGMPVIEAAACGTVSIVPLGSGVCKVFEDGEDAFYTKEYDTKIIVEKIKLLLDNPELAVEMGMKAYNRVKKGHTWIEHSKKLLEGLKPYYERKD